MNEEVDESDEYYFDTSPHDLLHNVVINKLPSSKYSSKSRRLSVREIKILRAERGVPQQKHREYIQALWRMAFAKVLHRGDLWEQFHLQDLPDEFAKRHRYNALKCKWVVDTVRVKVQTSSFNRGAMRECFRVKKLSNFSHSDDWNHASNYVAKRYIEPVDEKVYFEDVRLQMDAKLWGEEYSRMPAVAKKVDIAQMCVLEFFNRADKPLYHLEHFIEGNYHKYNSNSGFVDDCSRNTPQAFSHFTFERSGHRLIVVDIQGVGDLWTDPQIHTSDGQAYGDGNLGIRGMALFFHTHRCNPLCKALELSPFDLLSSEQTSLSPTPARDQVNGTVEQVSVTSSDSNQCLLGATEAIPQSKRRYQIRRLVSENLESSLQFGAPIEAANEQLNGDFVNPFDFTELSHSLPPENMSFLPPLSPTISPNSHLPPSFQPKRHDSGVDEHSNEHGSDIYTPSLPSPLLIDTSRDSGVSFCGGGGGGGSNFMTNGSYVAYRRRRNQDSECWPDSIDETSRCEQPLDGRRDFAGSQSFGLNRSNVSSASSKVFSTQSKKEADLLEFSRIHQVCHRSASVVGLRGADCLILGLIHHEMARMHAVGRFNKLSGHTKGTHLTNGVSAHSHLNSKYGLDALAALHPVENVNWEAVLFHEDQACTLLCFEAVQDMANYNLGLPINGPLADCPIQPDPNEAIFCGLTLMGQLANAGDRRAMLYLAEVNYTGNGNEPLMKVGDSSSPKPDWMAAAHWYEVAAKTLDSDINTEDDEDEVDKRNHRHNSAIGYDPLTDWPVYRLHGRLAEMYLEGLYGLKKDLARARELFESAADGATEALQGRLAMKYYEQAALLEECDDGEVE